MNIEINDKLYESIVRYCEFNGCNDIVKTIEKYINIGFNFERFGSAPYMTNTIPSTFIENSDVNKNETEHIIKPQIEVQNKNKVRIIKHD